ncbi:hypothetical protein [Streptomyces sp. NRRL F-4489]|uniref:hypothetical protein n=1 Tax=Streptomyces sp. NRRL F-4489 TaxID=1609095 RepID=UPI00082B027B|nr:hypothetical protein [Streptomyces sp. NRRL F-4489]
MTYNLFLVDSPDPAVMAGALATIFEVPVTEVDVADADGDQEDRNWDALVSCEYSEVQGNLSLSLDIYAQDSVGQQPSEAEISATLAHLLDTPVLYPPQESAMSAHWLVAPGGLVTRARLTESDGEEPTFTVAAVEAFVDRLPDVPVMHLPEVVREQKIATPLADAFAESVESLKQGENGANGLTITPDVAETVRIAKSYLGAWEKLSRRAEGNWAPSDWYPLEFYREVLEYRDDIEGYVRQLPGDVQTLYRKYLNEVDGLYREQTVEDHDHVVAGDQAERVTHLAQKAWWWYRRPEPMPWSEG